MLFIDIFGEMKAYHVMKKCLNEKKRNEEGDLRNKSVFLNVCSVHV